MTPLLSAHSGEQELSIYSSSHTHVLFSLGWKLGREWIWEHRVAFYHWLEDG